MIDHGKRNVLGVLVDAVDYEAATCKIMAAAKDGHAFPVTALAVHGVMTAVKDKALRHRLNRMALVTPDGQPVRWALNLLYRLALRDRVYGPNLMLRVCRAAMEKDVGVFLYGSTPEVLANLEANLLQRFPGLRISGTEPSKFRTLDRVEQEAIGARMRASGAGIGFVGLGCPRQEFFAYEIAPLAQMPLIAVGAAFDYHAGMLKEPPERVQALGLQWLYRLLQDPKRLWRRYVLLNPSYLALLATQLSGIKVPRATTEEPGPITALPG